MTRWWAWLLVVGLAVGGPVLAAETYVVAAGVDQYDDPEITGLKFAVADATALVEAFRAAGVPEAHLTLLTSTATEPARRPTKANVLLALQRVRGKATAADTVVFFFAGHGLETGGRACLLTVDTIKQLQETTALELATVRYLSQGFQAERVLFIIDACRNDPDAARAGQDAALSEEFARSLRPRPLAGGPVEPGRGIALLLACDVGQRAYELPDEGHGVFSHYLLRGLGGEARDEDGAVRLRGLAGYVEREIGAWAERNGKEQRPRFEPAGAAEFVLVRPGQTATVMGEVLVRSEPAGATILLGERVLGQTPATVELAAGEQTLELRLAGHEAERVTVQVRPREIVQTAMVPLLAVPGQVVVTTEPAGATVLVDGRETGEQTPCVLTLPPGPVRLGVALAGRESREEEVTAVGGKTLRLPTWRLAERLWPPQNWPSYLSQYQPVPGMQYRVHGPDRMPQVLVPAGEFLMGSTSQEQDWAYREAVKQFGDKAQRAWFDTEGPQKRVFVSAFWLDLHEVTNEQYAAFLNASRPSESQRKEWVALQGEVTSEFLEPQLAQRGGYAPVAGKERYPVVWVSWNGAAAYAQWAGRELPTEAQWEKAARGGGQTKYVWGDSATPPRGSANLADETAKRRWSDWSISSGYDDGHETTAPVGSFAANPFGLLDMAGNVWEWCRDWYAADWYARMGNRDPLNTTQSNACSCRGGSWGDGPAGLRVASRDWNWRGERDLNVGFRCVGAAR